MTLRTKKTLFLQTGRKQEIKLMIARQFYFLLLLPASGPFFTKTQTFKTLMILMTLMTLFLKKTSL
jgi:hypothetical protein